jgi:hypothetical protein
MPLAYYYPLLRKKEEELQRVYRCESKLMTSQAEFQAYQRFIMEPVPRSVFTVSRKFHR